MSLNSSAAQPPLSPQQQDTGLPAALPPDTPDVANPSELEQTEPVLANRSATNSSAELADELNQPPITGVLVCSRCDSQRSRRYEFGTRTGGASPFSTYADSHDTCR